MSIKSFIYFKIIPLINSGLRHLSLKIVTSRTPNRNFHEFFAHLKKLDFHVKTVIDVGVGHGTESLYKGTSGAQYILIEPVPDTDGIVQKIASRLNAEFFNVAAGDFDGEIDFNLHKDVTGSSMFKQLESDERINGSLIKVPIRRLDSIITKNFQQPCLLKIDTQGAELSVIRGAKDILNKVEMIVCEVSFHQFRHGAPEVADVICEMAEWGYVPYEILEGHYRSADDAMAQVDVAFVRKDSALRKVNSFFANEQVEKYLKSGSLR